MTTFTKKLLERRIPQFFAVYIGVSWGFMQFTKFMVDEFVLSPHWTRVVIVASLLFWPSFLILVYNHGRPGPDKWKMLEKISIPTNLIVAISTLYFLFQGEDLGAATRIITLQNEDGETIERVVSKMEFRKRTTMFEFDPIDISDEDDWVPWFISGAVTMDMISDDFFDPVGAEIYQEELRSAGFQSLFNIPLTLKLEIAKELHTDWLFSGSVGKSGDDYVVTTQLHNVLDGNLEKEEVYTGDNLPALVDIITLDLRKDLAIPQRESVQNLPVQEYLTSNEDALIEYIRATADLTENDWEAAIEHLATATSLDPTFALAQYLKAAGLVLSNRAPEAVAPMQMAMNNIYRIPERLQFVMKSDYYFINQDIDKAWAVIEMWADLYPNDLQALGALAQVQGIKNLRPEMVITYTKMYELNSGLVSLLQTISQLHVSLGQFDKAEITLASYIELFPEDYTGFTSLANILMTKGDHIKARENYEHALLMEPTKPDIVISLATLEHRLGNSGAALAGLEQALQMSTTAVEKMNTWQALQNYYRLQGQTEFAINAMLNRFTEASTVMPPVLSLLTQMSDMGVYFDAGRNDEAIQVMESINAQLQGPMSMLVSIGDLIVAIETEDIEMADNLISAVETVIIQTQSENLRPVLNQAKAKLAELKGDWKLALNINLAFLQENPSQSTIQIDISRCLRHLGQLAEAQTAVLEALRVIPSNPGAFIELSYVLEELGDEAGAINALQSALTMWSDADEQFLDAQEARNRLQQL